MSQILLLFPIKLVKHKIVKDTETSIIGKLGKTTENTVRRVQIYKRRTFLCVQKHFNTNGSSVLHQTEARLGPRRNVFASSTKIDKDIHNNTSYISKGSSYMSPTHTIHDFVLSHRSKPVMVLLVLPTNRTQSTQNLNVVQSVWSC